MYENYKADGYKQLITLTCPPNITKKDLRNWWFEHSERVRKLPALKFYAIYFNVEDKPAPPPSFDSYEELRFDSLDDLKNTVISLRTSFPDCTFIFDDIVVKGDKIVIFATFTGTNTGPLDDLPATGKKAQVSGVYIYHIVNGKIAEEWTFFNLLDYYQQLGYTLTPPEPPEKN